MWRGLFAPRLPVVSLPAESPRPASAFADRGLGDRQLAPQLWPTSTFVTHRQAPTPTAPTQDFGRNHEYPRPSSSASKRNRETTAAYYSSMPHGRVRMPEDYPENRPRAPERTRSMTPTPAPLRSILKSSRTRSHSMSGTHTEPRTSNLSKLQPVALPRTKPLKEESIALSWPLVQFSGRRRLSQPLLHFDVGFNPRDPSNLKDDRSGWMAPMPEADRKLPVSTHCTITEMTIQCPKIGKITVRRSKGVRIIDVFIAVYDAYHEKIRPGDFPKDQAARYIPHFYKRCDDCANPAEEQEVGWRRVDLLRGKRIFDGLSRSSTDPDWKLNIDSRS
ncbi:hypothetical protein DFH08DRAFT_840036 [Mycena albidolilacea]|uniref:DUF6699 domain-containing protein n=1 Tax=Mycena albidolilacea TaxID=1033008 RepID=A0AAD7F4F3_9AGAR|nr:hypothetical protein DFH08DRAFT_840036 [Mycena albidolilacea]